MLKCHLGAGTILLVFREFIKLSCDVLQEFFESNPEDTERLLTRNRPRWRNLSCLEIAFRLKHRPFMSHEACKIPINKIWFGHISPENNSFRVWTVEKRVIFIFYLCRAFFFFKEDIIVIALFQMTISVFFLGLFPFVLKFIEEPRDTSCDQDKVCQYTKYTLTYKKLNCMQID